MIFQIANEALVISVDKYVMDEESSSFHSMAIGRIVGNLIENGEMASAATIGGHARKKLYQIRKILGGAILFPLNLLKQIRYER